MTTGDSAKNKYYMTTKLINSLASDNVSAVNPEIMDALVAANSGIEDSYGEDTHTANLEKRLGEVFETPVRVFPVTSGTAANALTLSALAPRFGKIFCHALSHINTDECGAPEFFSGGAKLALVDGQNGKMTPDALRRAIYGAGNVHHSQPAAISITQACESGVTYQLDEIRAIAEVARRHQIPLHMDGARFANALTSLDTTPAEMTWKSGVEVLSFGGTKNGCMIAEAVVFFNHDRIGEFPYLHKRAGQLLSKMRYISAQFEAYLKDDLWLKNARHANAMAADLSTQLGRIPGVNLAYPTQCNEVFVQLPPKVVKSMQKSGVAINDGELDGAAIRFVAAWNTTAAEIDTLISTVNEHCHAATA